MASSENSSTTVSFSAVSPWSADYDVSCSSSWHLPTPFPLGADFVGPSSGRVFALQSSPRRPMHPQRKHSLSVLPFPPPLVLPLVASYQGLVETFMPFLISKRYNSPSSPSTNSSVLASFIAGLVVQISHHHWSRTTSATVDDCHDVCPHLSTARKQMLLCCYLFLKISGTHGEKNSTSHVFG